MAVGLGSVDTPVPSIAEWEWLNWKFPRPVHAGDTIYARWTLTQKRPPVGGAPSAVVVWRVDVHTVDGGLCAEGEIGATVKRNGGTAALSAAAREQPAPAAPRHRGRGRRSRGGDGAPPAALPEPPAIAAPPAAAAKPERTSGATSRRRRRRRSGGSAAREEEHEPRAAHVQETAAPPAPSQPPAPPGPPAGTPTRRGLGGVLRRIRGT